MPVKGSKSTSAKVVKKTKKDPAVVKKSTSKVAKKLGKNVAAIKKPASKAKADKKITKAVAGAKKPIAKGKKPVAKAVKTVKKSVKSLAKKKPALKATGKTIKAAVKKTGAKVKKSVKKTPTKVSKAKPKKAVKSKTSGSAKSKKPARKAKSAKKSKSAKEEKAAKASKPLKKKLVKTISPATPAKVAPRKAKEEVSSARTIIKSASNPSTAKVPATSFMSGEIPPYREKVGEEYMNEMQQKHFQKLLHAWKEQLVHDMAITVHHMQDEAANFPDPNDRATQEEEFSLELRTRDRELKLVKKIEEALHKFDNHEYGYCESCGVKIGIRRLEARPTAALCIDCKTLDEIREKQMMGG